MHIFIVESDVLNSMWRGGANIFIYTQPDPEQCDTPDMLIGVIAHETGHIAGGHLAQGEAKLKDAPARHDHRLSCSARVAGVAAHQPGAAAAVIKAAGKARLGRNFIAFTRVHEERKAADQSALTSLDKVGNISASGLLEEVFGIVGAAMNA